MGQPRHVGSGQSGTTYRGSFVACVKRMWVICRIRTLQLSEEALYSEKSSGVLSVGGGGDELRRQASRDRSAAGPHLEILPQDSVLPYTSLQPSSCPPPRALRTEARAVESPATRSVGLLDVTIGEHRTLLAKCAS